MSFAKVFIVLILFFSVNLSAYDGLVKNEAYFKKAIEKSKVNDFGKGRVIAILDTGINENSELKGKVIAEYDFTINSPVAIDSDGHGTKIASVIAAANDGQGITGIAYNAKLIDAKVVDKNGNIKTKDIIRAIEFSVKHGANVINMSFSSGEYSQELQNVITKYAKKGVIFVASAGNEGSNDITYPAGYKYVVAVGSLDRKTGKRAIYSNYGKWINKWVSDGIWTYDGKKYSREYGTSEASAVVSGTVKKPDTITYTFNNRIDDLILSRGNIAKKYFVNDMGDISNKEILDIVNFDKNEKQYLSLIANSTLYNTIAKKSVGYIQNKYLFFNLYNGYNNADITDKEISYLILQLFDEYISITSGGIDGYKKWKSEYDIANSTLQLAQNLSDLRTILKNLVSTHKMMMDPNYHNLRIVFSEKNLNYLIMQFNKLESINMQRGGKPGQFSYIASELAKIRRNMYPANFQKPKQLSVLKKILVGTKNIGSNYYTKYKNNLNNGQVDLMKVSLALNIINFAMETRDNYHNMKESDYKKEYLKEKAEEFLYLLRHITENCYLNQKPSANAKKFIEYVHKIPISKEGIEKYIIPEGFDWGKFTFSTGSFFVNSASILLDNIFGIAINNLTSLVTLYMDYHATQRTYLLWRSLLNNMSFDSLYFNSYQDISQLKSDEIAKKLSCNLILYPFIESSVRYLKLVAKDSGSASGITFSSTIKIDTHQVKADAKGLVIGWLQTIALAPALGWRGIVNSTIAKDKNEISFAKYLNYVDSSNLGETHKIYNYAINLNNLIYNITTYKQYLYELYQLRDIADEIYNDNNKNNILKKWKKIKNTSEMILARENLSNNDDIRLKLMLNIDYNYYYGYSLFDYRDIKRLSEPISRKDYFIMMLKAIDENPYKNSEFMKKFYNAVLNNNKKFFFSDIDSKQNGQGLTLNEKIWLTYGKYYNYIKGDGNKVYPFKTINRATAMAIAGRFFKSKIFYKDFTKEAIEKVKKLKIVDYNKVEKNFPYFKDDIDACLAEGIIVGKEENDKKVLDLNSNFTYNSAITVALRVENGIRKEYEKVMNNVIDYSTDIVKKAQKIFINRKRFLDNIGNFPDDTAKKLKEKMYDIFQNVGENALSKLNGGKLNKIKIKTTLKREVLNKFSFKWVMAGGSISKVENIVNDKGYIEFYIYAKPEKSNESYIVPLEVVVVNSSGKSLTKTFYYQVINNNDSSISLSNAVIQFTSLYLKNNQFKLTWDIKNAKSVNFEYSFDEQNWNSFANISLPSSKTEYTKTISEAKNYTKIYFRANVLDKNGNHIYKTIEQYYTPEKEYVKGAIEKPAQTTLHARQNGQAKSAELWWKKIIDSRYKLNVDKYEIKWINLNSGEEETSSVSDNSDPNNLYSSNHKIINGLDEAPYEFLVRGCNDLGCGEWSNRVRVNIKIPHEPVFTGYFYPPQGQKRVEKKVTFMWSSDKKGNKDVYYKVYWGEDKSHLNSSNHGWITSNDYEVEKPLKPNTTYYWQVVMQGDDGKNIKSPIHSFTTANVGYNLAILDVKPLNEIKPNSSVTFRVKVKNIDFGEKAPDTFIVPYYKKNGKITRFKTGEKRIGKELAPGEETTVDVTVKFSSYVAHVKSGLGKDIVYDNVLVPGESDVVMDMPYLKNDGGDINEADNKYSYHFTYNNAGAPKFEYFALHQGDLLKTFDNADSFYGITNKNIQIKANISDDTRVSKVKIEYRVYLENEWHLLKDWKNESDTIQNYSNAFDWNVPSELANKKVQIRIMAYDDQNKMSFKTTPYFPIYSDKIEISNISLDKDEYKVGDVVTVTYDIDNDNDILTFNGDMISGTTKLQNVVKEYYKDGGQLSGTFSFKIPNENRYANDNAYISLRVKDIYYNKYEIKSPTFKIKPNTKLDNVFKDAIRLFKKPSLPQNALNKGQYANVKFVKIDANNIVHTIVSYKEKYFLDTQSGDTPDEFHYKEKNYYITYDYNSKEILKKIEIPQGEIVSMELNEDNIPYILIQRDRQLFFSYLEGDRFIQKKNILNPDIPKTTTKYVTQINDFHNIALPYATFYLKGKIYDINDITGYLYSYKFNNGYISNKEKIRVNDSSWLSSISYCKPVSIGNKIYFIDRNSLSKLVEVDIFNKSIKTYSLPYAIPKQDRKDRYLNSFGIANGNGKLYLFIKGEVYKLDGSFRKVSDIEYEFDGKNISLKNNWDNYVKKMLVVNSDRKIYIVLEKQFPNNGYDIIEFDPVSEKFTKKIIENNDKLILNNTHSKSGFGSSGSINDYIYYKGKLLVLSQHSSPFSDVKFYDVGLNMLDLETGDVISLGTLNIPAKHLRFVKEEDGDIYIISENYDNKNKVYKLNLKNIELKLKYFKNPQIKKFKNKLLVTYEYGNIFDGRYSGYKTDKGYYYSINRKNKVNRLKEIYPTITDEYKLYNQYLYQWNYENNFVYSSSTGTIYETNENGSIKNVFYREDKYDNGAGFSYTYTNKYITAFMKKNSNISILNKQKDLISTNIIDKGYYDKSYLYDNYMIHIGYDNGKYRITKYYYNSKKTSTILLNYGSYNNKISPNNKGVLAIGWNNGEPYIAVANLSKDIIAPNVEFKSSETILEKGSDIVLKWSANDNSKITKVELYKVENGQDVLLKEFSSANGEYNYAANEKGMKIFKVVAYDDSGNIGYDKIAINIVEPVVFNSFDISKKEIKLGDSVQFSWQSNGDNHTKYSLYLQEIHSTIWKKITEVKGKNSFTYKPINLVGIYRVKIVANGKTEKILEDNLHINGNLIVFYNDKFTPKGKYYLDSKTIPLQWLDNSQDETMPYDIWIKKKDDDKYQKIASVQGRQYNYILNQVEPFSWKVGTQVNGEYIESDPINVEPVSTITTPTINRVEFAISKENDSIYNKINYTLSSDVKSYLIYRDKCNGAYNIVGNSNTDAYLDYNIEYGKCYSYKVEALGENGVLSQFSNVKSVESINNETYNVVIENSDNTILNGNSITLKYHPDKKVNYEKYKILIGKQPDNLMLYAVTKERNLKIDNLDYATTYYVKIYPIDFNGNIINVLPAKLIFTTGFDNRVISEKPKVSLDEVDSYHCVLSWDDVSNSDFYEIYRSEDGNKFEYLYKTTKTQFIDDIDIEDGKTYYYKIKATNQNSFTTSDVIKVDIPKICIQKITHAYNPKTGEEKDYNTPCDVPKDWIVGKAPDLDGDGINDIKDPDIDGDGIANEQDAFPRDKNEWLDTDGDGIGNNADTDDDNDGISDADEIKAGTNPQDENDYPDNDNGNDNGNGDNNTPKPPKNLVTLTRDGWNLISVCKDIDANDINMTNIKEIQNQNGESIYTGEWKEYSNLTKLKAGYGYWVKANKGTEFNIGTVVNKLEVPLKRDGWNLMGICQDMPKESIDMTNFQEIQNQNGLSIYTGEWMQYSNLNKLLKGYGVWVKGNSDTTFTVFKGLEIPKEYKYQTINNQGQIVEVIDENSVYKIKLFAKEQITPNQQANHVGVVVKINGQSAPIIQIQSDYKNKQVVAGVYNTEGKLIAVSEPINVSEHTTINVKIEEE